MKGKLKLIAVIFIVLAMTIGFFAPMLSNMSLAALADPYTVTFQGTQGHTVAVDGGHLTIDGNVVELRDGSNASIGTAQVTGNNTAAIAVADGTPGKLNYGGNNFTLYNTNGHAAHQMDTVISDNVVFMVEDYANNNQQGQGQGQQQLTGLNIIFEGTAGGKVWYKFNTESSETEVIGNRTNISIPQTAESITVRGEDRTIGRLDFQNGQMGDNLDKDAFKSTTGVTVSNINKEVLVLTVEYMDDGQGGEPGGPQQSGGPDSIEFDVNIPDTHILMNINDKLFIDDQDGTLKNTFKGTVTEAGFKDATKTNRLWIMNVYGDAPVIEVTVNGTTYKKGDANVTIGVDGEFIVTVPGAAKYTVVGKIDPNVILPRTVIWTNPNYVPKDAADAEWIKEFKLEHGYGYITAVYDEKGKLVDPEQYKSKDWVVNENGGGVGKDGFGWITLYSGYKVRFEFVPEYGYQLTDIRINGQKLGVSNLMNQFEFTMPNANIHFDAEFTKTEDIVKADSEKVSSGSIQLGNTLSGGSAQLKINDVELSDEKIAEFKNAAGDYTISNYLNIDLFQVFYKGKADSDDVWTNKIDELDNEALITMKLADGLTADDIVIVHNVHDGDEYEIIEIDSYDPETNTVTFRTKSFSNYAIATKGDVSETETEKETTNAKTGDNIAIYATVFGVALVGMIVVGIKFSKKNSKKQ